MFLGHPSQRMPTLLFGEKHPDIPTSPWRSGDPTLHWRYPRREKGDTLIYIVALDKNQEPTNPRADSQVMIMPE